MTSKTSKPFWADAARKTAVWASVASLAGVLADYLDEGLGDGGGLDGHHWWAIAAATAIRAIVALVQGNIGNPDKASFASASGPTINVPKAALRETGPDDPDVPDDDG